MPHSLSLMRRKARHLLAAGALLATAGLASAGLPNFDIQASARGATQPNKWGSRPRQAVAVPAPAPVGIEARYDALTGTATRVSRPDGPLTGPSADDPATVARRFITANRGLYGLTATEVSALVTTRRYHTPGLGVTHLQLGQQVNGIPVFRGEVKADVTDRGELLTTSGALVPALRSALTTTSPALSAAEALAAGTRYAGMNVDFLPEVLSANQGARRRSVFNAGDLFSRQAVVELTYYPIEKGRTALAWDVTLSPRRQAAMYHMLVDATTGELLFRGDYVRQADGQVFTQDAPQDGTPYTGVVPPVLGRTTLTFNGGGIFNGTALFPNGNAHFDWWNGAAQTNTDSNNVLAGLDRDGDENTLPLAAVGANFSFPLDLTQAPSTYSSAAVANLFYWNNRLHDVWYRYGFNEAAGNFQKSNLGLGGAANDAVKALAQAGADAGDANNAMFGTPPDGNPPVMWMFEFTLTTPRRDSSFDNGIIIHEYGHGVSNRLIGNANGLWGFQPGSMGEGWSDFQALMVLAQSADDVNGLYPMGGYVLNSFAVGIRRQPYSTNVAAPAYTYTYGTMGDEVHDAGEVMCNALWQNYGQLVSKLGFQAARDRMMFLFIDALKLCPVEPTFLDFRDKLLLADTLRYGGEDHTEIWRAFASRGMGKSATTTGPEDYSPVEAFDMPPLASIAGTVRRQDNTGVQGVTVKATGPGTETVNLTATDVPKNIPDNSTVGVDSTLVVSDTRTLDTVSVHVDVTHTWRGDLIIKLIHPDNTEAVLFNRAGNPDDGNNDVHQTFITSAFAGKPANGNWRLRVSDHFVEDVGTLTAWNVGLNVTTTVTRTTTTAANGTYAFTSLPAGQFTVVGELAGNTFTPASHSITTTTLPMTADFALNVADSVAPTMAYLNPKHGTFIKTLTGISGTAADEVGGSGLNRVTIQLLRVADNKLWRPGVGWVTGATGTFLNVNGLTSWSVTSALPTGASLEDGTYRIVGYVYDNAGNSRYVRCVFTVDSQLPVTLTFTTPTDGQTITSLTTIQGTASDNAGGTGIKAVYARIKRVSDSKYWKPGTGWVTAAANMLTDHQPSWTVTSALPSGGNLPAGQYKLIALAYDKAGNVKTLIITITKS